MLVESPMMHNIRIPSYLEIIDFIAASTTPQAIVDYRPRPKPSSALPN